MFFTYNQNNSGGSFHLDITKGITQIVIIEAPSLVMANAKALDIGIYFNGCEDGIDCECCGDRWSEPYHETGSDVPLIYGQTIEEWKGIRWMEEGKDICIHNLDGTMGWY